MSRSLVLILLFPLAVFAQQGHSLKPHDFAYGMPLEVDGDGALYSFDLPDEVYRYSIRHDHGDLRIFNGYGEVVSHLLRAEIRAEESLPESVSLPFYPILETRDGDGGASQINIATDENGTVLTVWQRGSGLEQAVIGRYLIDASTVQQPLERLLLDWDEEEIAEDFMVPISLESSNDLANWSPVATNAYLVSLHRGGNHLQLKDITLQSHTQAKYYRLAWPLERPVTSLQGKPLSQGGEIQRRWLRFSPIRDESSSGIYEFQAEGYYPIDRARIILPQTNTVVTARLFSRSQRATLPWQERYHGLLYKLRRYEHEISNDAVKLALIDDPHWMLEIGVDGGGLGRGEPVLELGWVPQKIYFVARGEAPFTLAFAAAGVGTADADTSSILKTLEQSREGVGFIKSASLGSMYELGGRYMLGSTPPPLAWQRWLLWATLLIGVLIVGLMARSLYQQTNNDNRVD